MNELAAVISVRTALIFAAVLAATATFNLRMIYEPAMIPTKKENDVTIKTSCDLYKILVYYQF